MWVRKLIADVLKPKIFVNFFAKDNRSMWTIAKYHIDSIENMCNKSVEFQKISALINTSPRRQLYNRLLIYRPLCKLNSYDCKKRGPWRFPTLSLERIATLILEFFLGPRVRVI